MRLLLIALLLTACAKTETRKAPAELTCEQPEAMPVWVRWPDGRDRLSMVFKCTDGLFNVTHMDGTSFRTAAYR